MGNSSSSGGRPHHDDSVDCGFLVPHGVYTVPRDWNHAVVSQFIVARRLAPFYPPLEEYDPSWDDSQILAARRDTQPAADTSDPVYTTSSRRRSRIQPRPEAAVYRGAVECPICFLVSHLLCYSLATASLRNRSSTIPPTSITRGAAIRQSAQNVLSRSNAQSPQLPILSQSQLLALIVFKTTLASYIVPLTGELASAVMDQSVS